MSRKCSITDARKGEIVSKMKQKQPRHLTAWILLEVNIQKLLVFCLQAKTQTITSMFFKLPLPGYRSRCRRTQQHCGLFHHASRSSECIRYRPKHWGNQAEILYPFPGHHPQHHKEQRLHMVTGGAGQRPRLPILQYHGSFED